MSRLLQAGAVALGCALAIPAWAGKEEASQEKEASQSPVPDPMQQRWQNLYPRAGSSPGPENAAGDSPKPADTKTKDAKGPTQSAEGKQPKSWNGLEERSFVRFGVDFTREFVTFTGLPSRTFIVDNGPALTVTPAGFSFPDAFKRHSNRIDAYLVAGTRGYRNENVNTYVSMFYELDASNTPEGSVSQNTAQVFSDKRTHLSNAYLEFEKLGNTGALSHTALIVGRHYVPSTSPDLLASAVIDGATARYRDARISTDVFLGRRVNFFSTPDDDITGGGRVGYYLNPTWSLHANYFFLQDDHRYAFEGVRRGDDLLLRLFTTFRDTSMTEFGVLALYNHPSLPLNLRANVTRRTDSDDFSYDVFHAGDDLNHRLRFGGLEQATLVSVDADYALSPRFSVGGTLDRKFRSAPESAFDNGYTQLTVRSIWQISRALDFLVQGRFRNVDREPAETAALAVLFDDTSRSGEEKYREFSADINYRISPSFTVNGGAYATVLNSRTRLARVLDTEHKGVYLRTKYRLRRWATLKFEYSYDEEDRDFNPDIDGQHRFVVGFDVRHN